MSARLWWAVTGAGAVVLLAACTTSGSTGSTGAPTTAASGASTSPPASSSASPSAQTSSASASPSGTGSAAATDLEDGRYPAYVVRVDAGKRRVTVDVVQFFTGKAAATAAAGDHSAEVPPPNDYWIRNASKKLRTLTVASGAPVTVNVLSAAESGSATKDTTVTLTKLASYPALEDALFWITVKSGIVTKVAEQYLP